MGDRNKRFDTIDFIKCPYGQVSIKDTALAAAMMRADGMHERAAVSKAVHNEMDNVRDTLTPEQEKTIAGRLTRATFKRLSS